MSFNVFKSIYLDWENNFILFGEMGRCPVSEFLEWLFGACSLGDLEHIEQYSLAQGLTLAHHENITHLDRCTNVVLHFLLKNCILWLFPFSVFLPFYFFSGFCPRLSCFYPKSLFLDNFIHSNLTFSPVSPRLYTEKYSPHESVT